MEHPSQGAETGGRCLKYKGKLLRKFRSQGRKKWEGRKCARESQAEGIGGRGRQASQDSGQKTEILTADSS